MLEDALVPKGISSFMTLRVVVVASLLVGFMVKLVKNRGRISALI